MQLLNVELKVLDLFIYLYYSIFSQVYVRFHVLQF